MDNTEIFNALSLSEKEPDNYIVVPTKTEVMFSGSGKKDLKTIFFGERKEGENHHYRRIWS